MHATGSYIPSIYGCTSRTSRRRRHSQQAHRGAVRRSCQVACPPAQPTASHLAARRTAPPLQACSAATPRWCCAACAACASASTTPRQAALPGAAAIALPGPTSGGRSVGSWGRRSRYRPLAGARHHMPSRPAHARAAHLCRDDRHGGQPRGACLRAAGGGARARCARRAARPSAPLLGRRGPLKGGRLVAWCLVAWLPGALKVPEGSKPAAGPDAVSMACRPRRCTAMP